MNIEVWERGHGMTNWPIKWNEDMVQLRKVIMERSSQGRMRKMRDCQHFDIWQNATNNEHKSLSGASFCSMQQQRSKVFCLLEAFFPVWHLPWELGECEMLDAEQEHISWCELCALWQQRRRRRRRGHSSARYGSAPSLPLCLNSSLWKHCHGYGCSVSAHQECKGFLMHSCWRWSMMSVHHKEVTSLHLDKHQENNVKAALFLQIECVSVFSCTVVGLLLLWWVSLAKVVINLDSQGSQFSWGEYACDAIYLYTLQNLTDGMTSRGPFRFWQQMVVEGEKVFKMHPTQTQSKASLHL